MTLHLTAVLILTACHFFGIRTEETPDYTVVAQDDHAEVRRYQPQLLVQTWAEGEYAASTQTAFRRLYDYISGNNAAHRTIPMMAPVIQARSTEATAITTPQAAALGWTMAFVVPSEYSPETAPKPTDPRIQLIQEPARTFAVIRYSGPLSEDAIHERGKALMDWIRSRGYRPVSVPQSAGYDPPWTLPFLRSNEVMVEIQMPQ